MSVFDKTQIKTININFNTSVWNPETHNIVLSYDPTSKSGFGIKMISISDELNITDLSLAQDVLQKFRSK